MKLFAHRGNWQLFPENSQAAIESSIKNSFDVELDIRFTADKQIVLTHDLNLNRLFNLNKDISELSFEEIKNLTYISNKNHHLTSFDAIAAQTSSYENNLAIHFKQDDQIEEKCKIIVGLFNEYRLHNNSMLFNLSLQTCQLIRELDEDIKLAVLISDHKFEPFVYLYEEVENDLELFDIFWAAEYKDLYSQNLVNRAHQSNKQIITVSPELHKGLDHPKAHKGYQDYWRKFSSWGVDGICTDYPKEIARVLQKVSQ